MEAYKAALAKVGDDFSNMSAPVWATLVPLITEEVVQDAHAASLLYTEAFKSKGLRPMSRPVKSIKRVQEKAKGTRPDVPFKVNSDLCAFQFEVYSVNQIPVVMKAIQDVVIEHGGKFFIRNPIQDVESNEFTDIVQYAFVYIPSFGYIAEIQVAHPFVMYTFHRDSILRDMRNAGKSTEGFVDLWDDNFYSDAKNYLLGKSTQTVDQLVAILPESDAFKSNLRETVKALLELKQD